MSTGPGNGSPQPVDDVQGHKPKLKLDERKSAPPETIKTTAATAATKPPNRLSWQ